ncbi:SNF5-domain-containing protein [Schizophyllum fasciatum]
MDKPDLKLDPLAAPPAVDATSSISATQRAARPPPPYHLPSLPANVNLNPSVSRVEVVPLEESATRIPPLELREIEEIKAWQAQDKQYEGLLKKMKSRMLEELKESFGQPNWWERGSRDVDVNAHRRARRREEFGITYTHPEQKKGRKKPKREGFRLPRKIDPKDANRPERLVPIRLEVDVEHHKLRDTFVWNLHDPVITPERFAQSVTEDYSLPPSYIAIIAKQIQEQLSDYQTHTSMEDGADADDEAPPITGRHDGTDAVWWESWRKRLRSEAGGLKGRKRRKLTRRDRPDEAESDVDMDVPAERPKALDEFKVDESKLRDDMRITVKLDIIVGSMKLEDQFEWDVEDSSLTPEDFAEVYAQDLGLAGEFKTAIAHCIREQVFAYKKSLYLVGHTSDAANLQDEELRQAFLPSLTSGARPPDQASAFTPTLYYASDGEIERSEKEREREMNRRRKRNTRGRRGVALPDRDPIRTYRTPAIGFPELDPAALAAAAAASAPTSRRAAAAAASLTIASMVASENGSPPFAPAQLPGTSGGQAQQTNVPVKEKKPKGPGLFTAPPFDPSVLRPRAQVTAPTRSTAADDDGTGKIRFSKERLVQREKEREKDAREKEYMSRQHPTDVDGKWHCSNCGRPEDLAGGKRKGPMGDKSQCAVCGKFWHRFRRPRPVTWTTDVTHHVRAVTSEKAQEAALKDANDDKSPPPTNKRKKGGASRAAPPPSESRRAESSSPVVAKTTSRTRATSLSSASDISDAPLAQTTKANGSSNGNGEEDSPTETRAGTPPIGEKANGTGRPTPTPLQSSQRHAPSSHSTQSLHSLPPGAQPPEWLRVAMKSLQEKYPTDLFEVVLRKVSTVNSPEWRIKCLDCPGKLYTPGSGETLQNYEVHLKNRQHRQRVNARLSGEPMS